jgi:O-antigen/teichoic acid export membrane protein
MAQRSTLQNAFSSLAGQVIARLLALALYAVLGRRFGPDLYGDMGLGTAFGVLFAVLVEPGLNPLLIRDGAREPEKLGDRVAQILGFKLLAVVCVWPAMVGLAALLGYRGSTLWAVALSGGTLLLVGFEDFGGAVLTARERMDLEGTLRGISKLFFAGAGLGAVALGGSFVAILAAMTAAQAATAVAMLLLVRRSGVPVAVRFDAARAQAQIVEAWPVAVTSVLWLVTLRLDQVLASQMGVSRADLGAYSGAVKLVEALILFPTAVALTFAPMLARAFIEGRERCSAELQMGLETALSICIPVAFGGALLAGPISTLVYGDRFVGTGPLLALQLLGLPLVAVQFLTLYALVAAGALRAQTLVVGANLAINVLCNLVLVPRLGILGATLAAVAGGLAGASACLFTLSRHGLRLRLAASSWRPLVCGLAMAAVVAALRDRLPFWACIGLGALVYLAGFNLLGGMRLVSALRQRRGVAAPVGSP